MVVFWYCEILEIWNLRIFLLFGNSYKQKKKVYKAANNLKAAAMAGALGKKKKWRHGRRIEEGKKKLILGFHGKYLKAP